MAMLFGREWTRRELEAHVGCLDQVAGLARYRMTNGPFHDVEVVRVRTGSGLAYDVVPTRGLDIGHCEFGGANLQWTSAAGPIHPAYYEESGLGWLRSAAGGLLMTCGPTYVGAPCEDEGQTLGIHGRAHHTPARDAFALGVWQGEDYHMHVGGTVQEASLFGTQIEIKREIISSLGASTIRIRDEVRNAGFASAPFMMLYHFNFGFPLMTAGTQIEMPSRAVRGREAELQGRGHDRWQRPTADFAEEVFYHNDLETWHNEGRPWTEATLRCPTFPVAGGARPVSVKLRWDALTLPRLVQWRMPGQGAHVLGIEPANCLVEGRDKEREAGTLRFIEPGEVVTHQLELEIEAESA